MSRCVCCNVVLAHSELMRKRKIAVGKDKFIYIREDMCNSCVEDSEHPKDWHEYQLEHLTEPLFSVYGNTFKNCDN